MDNFGKKNLKKVDVMHALQLGKDKYVSKS